MDRENNAYMRGLMERGTGISGLKVPARCMPVPQYACIHIHTHPVLALELAIWENSDYRQRMGCVH